jgi:hypothetical protein
VPVERFVGIGLVGPLTDRPVSGVCESSLSRPVPPRRGPAFAPVALEPLRDARLFARAPARLRSCSDRLAAEGGAFVVFFLRFALARAAVRPIVRFALARAAVRRVFRFEAAGRFFLAPVRADARAPVPARLFDAVRFCPFVEPRRREDVAFRGAAFLAMSCYPFVLVPRLVPIFPPARGVV